MFPPSIKLNLMVLLSAVRPSSEWNSTICLDNTNWAMDEICTPLLCDGYHAFCT